MRRSAKQGYTSRAKSRCHSANRSQFSRLSLSGRKLYIAIGTLLTIILVITLMPSQLFGSLISSTIPSSGTIGLDWLHTQGKNIVDSQGNIIILRGADFMGYGDRHSEQDYATMKSWGFNVVRLPIAWQYIEPQPGVFNSSYLKNNVGQDIAWAKKHGIYIILDMHQWYWSPYFIENSSGDSGNGMPWWLVSGYPQNYTGYQQAITDFWLGKAPNGTIASLSNPSMQDRFINAWKVVASAFKDENAVAGYDIFNEPYKGYLSTPEQVPYLYGFYGRLIPAIQNLDSKHIIIYEHTDTMFSDYARLLTYPNIAFSLHFYTLSTHYDGNTTLLQYYFYKYYNNIENWDIPIFVGEFGIDAGAPYASQWIHDTVDLFKTENLGWAWWTYWRSDYYNSALCYYNGTERTILTQYLKNP